MNSEQRKRIRAIQNRKKKREMQRKKTMRLVLGAIAILVIIIIVASIKGCNGANDNQNPEITVSPTPTMSSSRQIDAEFYADSCFIGNSFIKNLEEEDIIEGADYICEDKLDVSDALTDEPENSSVVYINELNTNKNYKKIFMAFGAEEIGWEDNDEFISEYKKVIDKAKKYQPDAEIYLLSVIPVSKDAEGELDYTNDDIKKLNKEIKELAKTKDVVYCDIFNTLSNSKGYLSESASEDGINLDRSYYEKSFVYIQKNYTEEAMARAQESDEDEESYDDDEETSSSSSSSSNKSSSSSSSSSNKSSSSSSSSSNKSSSSSSYNSSSSSSNKSSGSSSSSSNKSSSSSSSSSNASSSSSSSGSSSSNNSGSSSSSNNNSSSSSSSGNSSTGNAVSKDLDDM